MNAREFFYLVADMRQAQKNYFKTRDRGNFAACRALENQVDREIRRVKSIVDASTRSNLVDAIEPTSSTRPNLVDAI